jgi:hypothetical protein
MNLIDRFRHHRARTRFIRAQLEAHDQPSRLDRLDSGCPLQCASGSEPQTWPDDQALGLRAVTGEDVRAASVRLQAMVDGLPEQRGPKR